MADTKYKIGVEITGDDSSFKKAAKSSEKAVSDLEKKTSGDFAKIAKNFGGIFESKAKESGLGKFVGEVGEGTTALSAFAGPAAMTAGAIVGIGTAAVATGATLFSLAKTASDYGSDISDASQKTGLAVETISSMKFAGDAFGASFEEMTAATTKFTKLVGEAAKGNDEAKKTLIALGVDPQDALSDLDSAFGKAVKTIYKLPPGTQQANAAIDAFGKKGTNLLPVINAIEGDMGGLEKQARDLGQVISDQDVRAADEFGDTLEVLTKQATGAANNFAFGFMPKVTNAMKIVSGELKDNKDVWREWGEWVGSKIELATRNLQFYLSVLKSVNEYRTTGVVTSLPAWQVIDAENQRNEKNRLDIEKYSRGDVPDFLKSQFGDIDKLGRKLTIEGNSEGDDYLGQTGSDKKSKLKQELEEIKKKYFVGENKLSLGNGLELRKNLEALVSDPKVMLVLSTIKTAEGGAPDVFVGGRKVNDLTRHPGEYIPRSEWYNGPEGKSSASGNYQITLTNYKRLAPMLGISDFSPKSQAILALAVMREQAKAGFVELAKGNVEGALRKGTQPWASSSFSTLKGGKKNYIAIAEKLAGTGIENLSGDLGISEKKIGEGGKALNDFAKQLALVGVTTQQGRVEVELLLGAYKDLDDAGKAQLILAAGEVDAKEAQTKAIADLDAHLESLGGQYNDLNGVQKTATSELEKQLAAYAKTGNVIDPVIEANARNKALMVDMQSASVNLADASAEMTERYKAERDAVWELAAAHISLRNEMNRDLGVREEKTGGITDSIDWTPYLDEMNLGESKSPALFTKNKTGEFMDGLLGGNGNNLARFESEADKMKAVYNDLSNTAGAAMGAMIEGGAQLLEQWIMTGEVSGEAIAQMTASVIAGVASQAAVKSIFEVAEGLAALAGLNPAAAAGHFAAAKTYGLVALGATAVGAGIGAMGGLGGGKKDKSSYGTSSNPSEYFQNDKDDRNMNYLRESQSGSSQSARETSGLRDEIANLSQNVGDLKSRIGSMSPGNVLTAGVKQNPGFISDTVDRELAKNQTKATSFGRRLGMN